MRGVHVASRLIPFYSLGSSPHARGPPSPRLQQESHTGIIPACAGSTRSQTSSSAANRDHPRMRGVHLSSYSDGVGLIGSSPHARGPPPGLDQGIKCLRIIPACAGSTSLTPSSGCTIRDHPRMRGVHPVLSDSSFALMGSSPHARGPLQLRSPVDGAFGIIPACAGSTVMVKNPTGYYRDHPRMRGVHKNCPAADG